MAINIDHTNSANITLRGPAQGSPTDVINFVFPNTTQGQANLLVSGDVSVSAIAGLVDALNEKVSTSATGSAASLNAGTAPGEIPFLNGDGKLDDSVIPSVAIKDVFSVSTKSDLFGYSSARIGDVGIASADKKNYILTSNDYTSDTDWKEIVFPNQLVTSVNGLCGEVVLNGENVQATVNVETCYISDHLTSLYNNKLDTSCLANFATQSDLSTALGSYATDTDLSNCTSSFVSSTDFQNCIGNYYTSTTIDNCLNSYALSTAIGAAALCNVGTSAGDIVAVGNDGKIDNSLVPSLAITDVFVIGTCSDLGSIVGAEEGDVAVATTDLKSFILDGNSTWQMLASSFAGITNVNGKQPSCGSVTIDSCDILVAGTSTSYDGCTITQTLTCLAGGIETILNDYVTTQEANDLLASYETVCNVQTALSCKADVGHTHAISDVTNLGDCLTAIGVSAFLTGVGSYSATQYGENNGMNEACGAYSIAMGYGAVAKQDYEIAHSAGWFSNPSDAQSSKIVAKSTTNSCDFTEVSYLLTDSASVLFFKVDMVGFGSTSAAFRVEGAANSSALLNNVSVTTFADSNESIAISAVHCGSCVSFQASGENGMKWVSNIQSVKLV